MSRTPNFADPSFFTHLAGFVQALMEHADRYRGIDAAVIYACLAVMFAGAAAIGYYVIASLLRLAYLGAVAINATSCAAS